MMIWDWMLRPRCCWPSLLLHCALHPLWGFIQITHGELQKSCSKTIAEKGTDSCQEICQCRRPPPLPPPPPPPPPPRLLSLTPPNSTSCPAEEPWWSGLVIIIAVCCATLVFLVVIVIICYKAIKSHPSSSQSQLIASASPQVSILSTRVSEESLPDAFSKSRKPLRKEENGTSGTEYAMTSSQNNKTVDVNNAVV